VNEKFDLSMCINCHGDAGHGPLTTYPEYCSRCQTWFFFHYSLIVISQNSAIKISYGKYEFEPKSAINCWSSIHFSDLCDSFP
jgi:hypothetical protein